MQCGGAGNARFASLARNVYTHVELRAQSSGLEKRRNSAQFDRLQADAARRVTLAVPLDVLE
jgi:hypothetical protein